MLPLWLQLPNVDWELVKIITTYGAESVISLPDGKVLKVKEDNLVPAIPDILNGVDDLMELSYLNVPADLFILQYRYNQDMIYTKAGPVLVAVNRFKKFLSLVMTILKPTSVRQLKVVMFMQLPTQPS
ncbi:hypothetical protein VIGAN_04085700 [Vigna angularis var. angularis]|uniref:Myosin motor domain-containing protein n=2 Tax=Phaseolus angularis TaxID=3914 RepID=A0A0S3RST1_PHAAN|nr:hypothetical protein VIGAN_04085700 [Vigna angularis var. angularis]